MQVQKFVVNIKAYKRYHVDVFILLIGSKAIS